MDAADLISFAETLVSAVVKAAPAIEAGVEEAEPYVEAIVTLVRNGGNPSDDDWTALKARLDAGSAELQAAADEPDPNAGQGD